MKCRLSLLSLLAITLASRAFAEDAANGGKEMTIEDFLQSLSTVPDVVKRKDPFAEAPPPFREPDKDPNAEYDPNAPVMSAPILERYPITDYEVVAVLLGDQYPRALVRIPGEGARKVVIVKENDKLGNAKGVITKITLEGVSVVQAVRSQHGFVDKTEILLKVGSTAADQKKEMMLKQKQPKE